MSGRSVIPTPTFAAFMALAYPWVLPESPIWRELRHAWEAGYQAGKDAKE
jgi:hypothetical protein